MRPQMGLIEGFFEWAADFAGIIGALILLLLICGAFAFGGIFALLAVGVPIEIFIHDRRGKLVLWRVALVITVVVSLFLIRWYLPFAIAGAAGFIALFIELIGTRW